MSRGPPAIAAEPGGPAPYAAEKSSGLAGNRPPALSGQADSGTAVGRLVSLLSAAGRAGRQRRAHSNEGAGRARALLMPAAVDHRAAADNH